MITRKQYMDHEYTHEEYYAQYVNKEIVFLVSNRLGPKILNSKDLSFNNVDLSSWDALEKRIKCACDNKLLKSNGEVWSLCTAVCIAKQAARMWKARHENKGLEEEGEKSV